jgi:hypothetical protein
MKPETSSGRWKSKDNVAAAGRKADRSIKKSRQKQIVFCGGVPRSRTDRKSESGGGGDGVRSACHQARDMKKQGGACELAAPGLGLSPGILSRQFHA